MATVCRALGAAAARVRQRLPSSDILASAGGRRALRPPGAPGVWPAPAWAGLHAGGRRQFAVLGDKAPEPPALVEVDYHALRQLTPEALDCLRRAFVGPQAYGAVAVANIPGYGEKLTKAFRAGVDLALADPEGRARAAAVNNTYPGWSGTPGEETHPLQSSFLFNVKEEIPSGKPDAYFGKNIFPSPEYRKTWVDLATPMHEAALDVLRGCDVIMEEASASEGIAWSAAGRSLHSLAKDGPALAGRFICYDSGFTREDSLLQSRGTTGQEAVKATTAVPETMAAKPAGHAGDGLASMRTHSTPVKSVGHVEDEMASMRARSASMKSAGHAGDGLPSMRTHSTPMKSAGHAGDGLASMRTHSTPVKSAGHAGDGLASMRTHSTPVKSAGHAGDGLASMRTNSIPVKSAGHAGDGLASMRTHSTPVKSAGHAGDGLASMRTHSTPVKSAGHAGDGLASMRTHSTPVKSAGHAGDGLASMRTHSTPVKSAGHAGDGLASMRTHSTPVKSAGHAADGLASMRTDTTPIKAVGHAGDGLASMRTHSTPVKSAGHRADGLSMPNASKVHKPVAQLKDAQTTIRPHSTQTMSLSREELPYNPTLVFNSPKEAQAIEYVPHHETVEEDVGDYWLPWHIDSNFVTVLHKERYASEHTAAFVPEPEGAGLLMMNPDGQVAKLQAREDVMILQMGAFAQIYAGGQLSACRHAVLSPRPPGVARFNYCNFWYVPWHTLCDSPVGREGDAVSTGWNAMMDSSYLNITMRQSFAAFRQFMTSPEARLQFADTVRFKELSELFPLPAARSAPTQQMAEPVPTVTAEGQSRPSTAEIVVDVLTDVRCPFSFISQTNLETALNSLGLGVRVVLRYHPIFLNPHVPKEGESLDDYLLREYGYSKEYAHSATYPLRLAGIEAGVHLNPNRRVVNTFDAFCLMDAAEEHGKQHEVVKALSRRYFEGAEDISDERVLRAAAEDCGLAGDKVSGWLRDAERRARVQGSYLELAARIGEVPHFLLRERVSGNGVEVGGSRSAAEWEDVLQSVLEKARFVGMSIPGPNGQEVWLAEANPTAPVSLAVPAQHGWAPAPWPFTAQDFSRIDESPDSAMYSEPRLVNHLDDASLARLTEAYRSVFRVVPQGFAVLDLCSSWTSHFPQEQLEGARVVVHGLNELELKANSQATEHHVQDLNADPRLPWPGGTFDVVTMALSVQYLTNPRAVFAEMHRVLKPGGLALIAHSHRCFIEKAVKAWADETYDGEGHTHLVCRYFEHSPAGGWHSLSSADVSPRHGDPVWLVSAVKGG